MDDDDDDDFLRLLIFFSIRNPEDRRRLAFVVIDGLRFCPLMLASFIVSVLAAVDARRFFSLLASFDDAKLVRRNCPVMVSMMPDIIGGNSTEGRRDDLLLLVCCCCC